MTQRIPDFVASHVRMFDYFDGVTLTVVPDQLKSAVRVPSRDAPQITRSYADLGQQYTSRVV